MTKELVALTNVDPEHVGVYLINTSSPNAVISIYDSHYFTKVVRPHAFSPQGPNVLMRVW